ncbi:tRNA (N(6)-L-threonylcarbamoyladenosine(37)-C(2))-methylthiotransferase [Candidatus Woesearchaeota archaeon]|nr:tRNA (N(6)-L-threonylcarbamoyladenosine(37)-C(2))-methylthiotransferase [Candidatus Woesearchaeota archaeon]
MERVFVVTFGCALNQSDSELMKGLLLEYGFKVIEEASQADLVIINSCTVKNSAENKLFKEIKKYPEKKIVVAGCVPQGENEYKDSKLKDYSIIGTKQLINVCFVAEETLKGNRVVMLQTEDNARLNLPKIRINDSVEIIPVNEGCVGKCSYCKTKQARGEVTSYAEKDILEQAKNAISQGVSQIWLTSQDTGAYGKDNKTNIVELLKKLVVLDGDFKIRLGMINPNHSLEHLDELCVLLNHEKMFSFLHVPLQSASDKILSDMNRYYSYEDFLEIIKVARQKIPDIRIATDIIIGYPTESEKDFQRTYDFVKEYKPEVLNISKYWKRPKTIAAKHKPLNTKKVKERSIKIKLLFEEQALETKKKYLGKTLSVIVEEKKGDIWVSRAGNYLPVLVKAELKTGQKTSVKITKTSKWDVTGVPK